MQGVVIGCRRNFIDDRGSFRQCAIPWVVSDLHDGESSMMQPDVPNFEQHHSATLQLHILCRHHDL